MCQALEDAFDRVGMVYDVVHDMRQLESNSRHFVEVHTRTYRPQDRHCKN